MSEEDERKQLIKGDESPVPYSADDYSQPPPAAEKRPDNSCLAWFYDHRASIPGYGMLKLIKGASVYSLYVLFVLLMAYLLNQLDRYTLPIVTTDVGYDLKYGDLVCMKNRNISQGTFDDYNITKNITDICSDEEYFDEDMNETLNIK